jgi:TM2 domain-containing membrane protein YozV
MALKSKPMPTDSLKPKDRAITIFLALIGAAVPGAHKFYLGQWGWGWLYLLPGMLFWHDSTGLVPRMACLFEFTWLLLQSQPEFDRRFNGGITELALPLSQTMITAMTSAPAQAQKEQVESLAQSLRQLEQLRQEGLISEYEFEQQRRKLLN